MQNSHASGARERGSVGSADGSVCANQRAPLASAQRARPAPNVGHLRGGGRGSGRGRMGAGPHAGKGRGRAEDDALVGVPPEGVVEAGPDSRVDRAPLVDAHDRAHVAGAQHVAQRREARVLRREAGERGAARVEEGACLVRGEGRGVSD